MLNRKTFFSKFFFPLGDLEKEPPPGITCYPKEDNITELEACKYL